MAYVRQKAQQVVIVHGVREAGTVTQKILFTFYSKAEAFRAIGRGHKNQKQMFQALLEEEYPNISFNWETIHRSIADQLHILPDLADYRQQRLDTGFKESFFNFTRQLIVNSPETNPTASRILATHRQQLEFLKSIIDLRIRESDSAGQAETKDNEFYWWQSMQAKHIDPQLEHLAVELFHNKNYASAEAAFDLLCSSFPNYAEGYNYLGLIYLKKSHPLEAVESFRKAVEVGRKLFPKRLAKSQYWLDLRTRPYIRGLSNLCLSLIRAGLYEEALDRCDLLEKECQESATASYYRSCIYLNRGEWQSTERSAIANGEPLAHILAAFAQFEQGKFQAARVNFIYGAANHPFAIFELMAEKRRRRSNSFEEEDTQLGHETSLTIAHYLARHSRKSRDFFKKIIANPTIRHHIDDVVTCSRNHLKLLDRHVRKDNLALWSSLKSYDHACKIEASSFRQLIKN